MDTKDYCNKIVRIYLMTAASTLLSFITLIGQVKYDYNWVFGYERGVPSDTRTFGGFVLKFDSTISYYGQDRSFDIDGQSHSFSDSLGELIYLSNGCLITDNNAKTIQNADTIYYGRLISSCPLSRPDQQAGFFLKFDPSDSITFLVHSQADTLGIRFRRKRIWLTAINDKTKSIIYKNKVLIKDTLVLMGLTAITSSISNANWIVNPKFYSNKYATIKLNSIGNVDTSFFNQGGILIDSTMDGASQASFSPNGKKYAIFFPNKGMQVFDFDRAFGIMSNPKFYDINFNLTSVYGGCAFSPNSRFVYINTHTRLLQVDLEDSNIQSAIDTVGIYDNFFDPYPTTFLLMQLGPDCRIYMSTYGGNRYLHVILYPDRKGNECKFVQRGLKLIARNAFALPNNPHYRVDEPWPCDSTIRIPLNTTYVEDINKSENGGLLIYPQPASQYIKIIPFDDVIKDCKIAILSLDGRELIRYDDHWLDKETELDISGLSHGVYIIQISSERRQWIEKIIVE